MNRSPRMIRHDDSTTRRYGVPRIEGSPMIMLAMTRLEDLGREIEALQLADQCRAARPHRRWPLYGLVARLRAGFRTRLPRQSTPA